MKLSGPPFVFAVAALGLAACASQVPLPTTYELTFQQKMQAAHHWNVLASHVAQRIHEVLGPPGDTGQGSSIPALHVRTDPHTSVFDQAFQDLLTTHLIEKGFSVSRNPAVGLTVDTEVQLVTHNDRGYIREHPGLWTTLAAGIKVTDNLIDANHSGLAAGGLAVAWDVWSGHITGPAPDSEVIISTSVMAGDSYRARFSNIYYVSDANRHQYAATPKEPVVYTRRMEVVDQ